MEGEAGAGTGTATVTDQVAVPEYAKDWSDKPIAEWTGKKGFKSVEDIAKSYHSLESTFGADRAGRTVVIPSDRNDVAQLEAFYRKLGRPDSPDNYKLEADDNTKDTIKWFSEQAFAAGLAPDQASKIAKAWGERVSTSVASSVDEFNAKAERDIAEVKSEWGDKWDSNVATCNIGWERVMGMSKEQVAQIEQVIGTKALFDLTYRIGKMVQEDPGVSGVDIPGFADLPKDAAGARKEIDRLIAEGKIIDELQSGDPAIKKAANAKWDYLHKTSTGGT